ncbi:uncharacterized protein H6S33_008513 [Morchella sextelata]|uniref:uncharacterized protein n=1 Tax=Morchella sextelata TaxID=1174677 RepID=UPI001D04E505|nr:uncharacterized protein H6S33_008513 [Morchella sextelata]KAH0602863.1 hypothetical protein H6S33_008513 [Morchella sextelata]
MAFRLTSAAPAIRSLLTRPSTATSRQFMRRMSKYTDENPHIIKGTNSDLPWIIGAVVVTIPTGFYLLSGNSKPDHHATHASTGHSLISKPHGMQDEGPRDISEKASQAAEKASEKASEVYSDVKSKVTSSDSSPSDTASEVEEKGSEKAQNLKEKASEKAEDLKGKTSEKVEDLKELKEKGSEKVNDLKEKGSEKAAELKKKAENESNQGKPPSETDKPAAAIKPPKSMNEQSGKQEGISNSETNHAVLHDERGQAISKKSEGTHDTAKLKGTVDPNREAR